jgi:transposase-like protein
VTESQSVITVCATTKQPTLIATRPTAKQMRKNIANRKVFPTDESVLKILFLNVRNFTHR